MLSGENNREALISLERVHNVLFQIQGTLHGLNLPISDLNHGLRALNKGLQEQINSLNANIKEFNNKSGRLTFWLMFWTAGIAIATIANVILAIFK
jgi:hypothetical protein